MNFRRCIPVMAVTSLFVGLASAQVTVGPVGPPLGPFSCQANVAVPPQLRAEGMTELIGDIVISCTGGTSLAPGTTIPTANITVSLGTNVTSRLVGGAATNVSEAVLLIDEPNTATDSATSGLGPVQPFRICSTPTLGAGPGGCTVGVSGAGTVTVPPTPPSGQSAVCLNVGCTSANPAPNTFQGLVNSNQVTFLGVPINPPVSSGTARVFRITNIRANVSALGGGGLAGTTQLLASVAISGSTAAPVTNPVLVAGFIQAGLSTSLRNVGNTGGGGSSNLAQCGGGGPSPLSVLRFSENFGTAFKTRVAPGSNSTQGSGQSSTPTLPVGSGGNGTQGTPGTIYNSESGLIIGGLPPQAGLADYGTRLKAVFNNVPAGVRIFVSTANVVNDFVNPITAPSAGNSTTSYGALVISETAPDANGFPPLATANASFTGFGNVTVNIVEIPIINGSGTAVWEVINTNANALDSLDFGVYQQFTANPGANSPPVGTATVNMSYAPTPPGAFSASAGGSASSSLTIPRFADTSSATNILSIVLCQTTLLYPFVTAQSGFDTGLAIANTTTDPFGTRTQNGTCRLNFYGASAPPPFDTPSIATGTVYTDLASLRAPGFQGYMIAVCNFQLAHGFAFISDLGARNLAMGYLALVLHTGTGNRNSGNLNGTPPNSIEAVNH